MANPFVYAAPVRGEAFCDRGREVDRTVASLAAGEVTAVSGTGGAGASSLARQVQRELRAEGVRAVRADLWELEDDRSAARLLAAGLARAGDDSRRPPGNEPDAAEPSGPARAGVTPKELLDRLGAAPGPAALLLDDAGRLVEAECPETVEALRAAAGEVGLGLFGTGASRPAQGGAWLEHDPEVELTLGPIPLAAWLPYALERFLETGTWVANEHVEEVVRTAGGHPRRTQELLAALWELAHPAGEVEDGHPDRALRLVLERRGPAHRALWETLTANQRRTLLGLALEGGRARPYSSEFVQRYGLAAASSVQRAVEALRERGLLSLEGVTPPGGAFGPEGERDDAAAAGGDAPRLADPLLARWLRQHSAQATTRTGR